MYQLRHVACNIFEADLPGVVGFQREVSFSVQPEPLSLFCCFKYSSLDAVFHAFLLVAGAGSRQNYTNANQTTGPHGNNSVSPACRLYPARRADFHYKYANSLLLT